MKWRVQIYRLATRELIREYEITALPHTANHISAVHSVIYTRI